MMSKAQFYQAAQESDLYTAAWLAKELGVSMAQVQLWVRSKQG